MTATTKSIKQKITKTKRKREVGVNIRMTNQEKKHLDTVAKACRLSRSELVRQLTNGVEVRAIPPDEFYSCREELERIRDMIEYNWGNELPGDSLAELKNCVDVFKQVVEKFYGDNDGDNENLAD